jgi:MoaA/NifB/PqqE/SkfB family radical SAM enzyme/diadenosine tetraphosphatase ApaH/serine/threonine PP2A family protein phosphatase
VDGSNYHKTLVIEVGVSCNNRCVFCYQRNLRRIPSYPKMLSFSEVEAKLRWGKENGFDEVSLTGGEPTIRPDFLEIVKLARTLGYRRVAVTTNGFKLGDHRFFQQAIHAGLTSIGVSIHGHTEELHEGLTGHLGSFKRALGTIQNAVEAQRSGIPIKLNTFTLVNKRNAQHLLDMAQLFYRLGVRLMMFQPLILSKSNFFDALALEMPLSRVVEAVSRVAIEGQRIGFRTKVFNIPLCLFSSCLGGFDLPYYAIRTFREQDKSEPGSVSMGDEAGNIRMANCNECVFSNVCPGLHVSLVPQEDLVHICEDSIKASSYSLKKRLWLRGTDLLDGASLARLIRVARHEGFSKVLVTHGGLCRWHQALLRTRKFDEDVEVVFVHHQKDPHTADRIIASRGNDEEILRCMTELVQAHGKALKGRVGVLVSPSPEALDFLKRKELEVLDGLMATLHIRGDEGSIGRISWFIKHLEEIPFSFSDAVLEAIEPSRVGLLLAYSLIALKSLGKIRFSLWDSAQNNNPLLHPFYGVLNWSDPRLTKVDADSTQKPSIFCRTIKNTPITMRLLRSILKTPYAFERA